MRNGFAMNGRRSFAKYAIPVDRAGRWIPPACLPNMLVVRHELSCAGRVVLRPLVDNSARKIDLSGLTQMPERPPFVVLRVVSTAVAIEVDFHLGKCSNATAVDLPRRFNSSDL